MDPQELTALEKRRFRAFVAAAGVLLVVLALLPAGIQGVAAAALAATALAVVYGRCVGLPHRVRLPAVLIVSSGVISLIGSLVRALDAVGGVEEYPFPSIADVFPALAYASLICAIGIIVRRRVSHLTADPILDGMVGGLAAALLNWTIVLPYLQDPARTTAERVVTIAFSGISLLALTAAILALVVGGRASVSSRLLAVALMVTFVMDVVANLVTAGVADPSTLLYLSTLGIAIGGAGLLHPSVRTLADPPQIHELRRQLSNRRITVFTFALMTPPVLLLWQVATNGSGLELLLPALGAIVLSPLVLVRLGRLVRQNEAMTTQESTLRSVGERLVAAETEIEVSAIVLAGLDQIFGDNLIDGGLVAVPFRAGSAGWTAGLAPALRSTTAELDPAADSVTGEFRRLHSVGQPGLWHAGLVVVQREVRGVVLAATQREMTDEERNAFVALCRQGAIALRAVEATEQHVRERSEERFAALIENSADIVAILTEEGTLSFVSPVVSRLLGYKPEIGVPLDLAGLVHPDDVEVAREMLASLRFGTATAELRLRHDNGYYRWFEVMGVDLQGDPNVAGMLLNARDVDDRRAAEDLLVLSESRFKALVQHSSDLVLVVDSHDRVRYVSPSSCTIVGEEPDELVGRHLAGVFRGSELDWDAALRSSVDGGQTRLLEFGFTNSAGDFLSLEARVTDLRSEPAVGGFVVNATDITERKAMLRHLRHQATHDTLTGLANRVLAVEELDRILSHNPGNSSVATICIDIDDFRDVNDSLGHSVGDDLLIAVAERLRGALQFGDVAARIGADEFAIIVERARGEEVVLEIAQAALALIRQPLFLHGRELNLSASAGVAFDHERGVEGEGLLRNAITALHHAKAAGRERIVVFESTMRAASSDRLELRADLARAIGTDQIVVWYQPIVELSSGRIRGAEALVRWDHPVRGRLSPALFIPIAEDTGLIRQLGEQVLERACHDLATWRVEMPEIAEELTISVNLSPSELHSEALIATILRTLDNSGIPPGRLVLEVTESNLLDDSELVRERMAHLRSVGVRLAIDDFGTGYSSLGYIQRFDFDLLKIDRTFVEGLGNPTNQRIVTAVLDLADQLDASVVAEGIETSSQEQTLLDMGCGLGQGYLYSRPVAAGRFRRLLKAPLTATSDS